ncbi:MAG TPA: hypothetical protein DCK86_09030 [Rhodobacter sp.]|jgi:hypothetical protein|nr:hypothetical protein [Rhodobacter sp.]
MSGFLLVWLHGDISQPQHGSRRQLGQLCHNKMRSPWAIFYQIVADFDQKSTRLALSNALQSSFYFRGSAVMFAQT